VSLYKRGRVWWSRIEWRGEILQRSTKCRNRRDALDVEAAWRTALAKGEAGLLDTRSTPTLAEFERRFLEHLPGRVAARTEGFYRDAWAHLVAFKPLGASKLYAIDEALIARFVADRRGGNLIPATINHSMRTLRRALRLAVDWKLIQRVPKIKLLPGERQREYVISEKVLAEMLAHEKCTPLLRRLLPFLVDTGLRLSEALALTSRTVSLEPKPGAERGWVYVAKGKSKYAVRYVPLTTRAAESLRQAREVDGRGTLFGVNRHDASHQFTALRNAMGLPWDCVVHSCRHTFCTRLGESGADAFTIQKLAGHSSITISQRYVHPTPERLERAIGGLEHQTESPRSGTLSASTLPSTLRKSHSASD
jgi:integrase